ncbi:glycosyltransferase family 1 protein [Russula ochroleuca]|uniref:UDP-N-acetylglucosamine transferase subunit ALG14 n=1 Tax=Russula ochroleuca TaxID=152965 RepID=A0A9P5MZX6_9AGAM|nr:glycosyltransferase family 1 protein [Russula ochroleuca]
MHSLIWLALAAICVIIARICVTIITPSGSVTRRRSHTETCHLAVFLGSGGHSSEALSLVSALDFSRYTPRTYLVSEGDSLSAQKAVTLERLKTASAASLHLGVPVGRYQILTIPRARHVHQNILTVPFTTIRSFLASVYHVTFAPRLSGDSTFDVMLLNGPGTCVVLCIATYVNRFLGLPSPRLIYVETFARVRVLSLTGKLLRPIVDRFVVQWPDMGGRGEYHGWLV